MKKIILILFVLLTNNISPQSNFQNFLNRVNSISDSLVKAAVIDSFINYARTQDIPFIEGNTANFLYRGSVSSAAVPGDFNEWSTSLSPMTRLPQTNFFYYSRTFEMNARLDYKFVSTEVKVNNLNKSEERDAAFTVDVNCAADISKQDTVEFLITCGNATDNGNPSLRL